MATEQQFVETIKIKDGRVQAIAYHQARMERTLRHFFPALCPAIIPSLAAVVVPNGEMDLYKARVVYGGQGIEAITYAPYTMRDIHSLRVVEDDTIEYGYKSTDRSRLNSLAAIRGDCDEVIIVKQGFLTDTSFTNLAIYDGRQWLTPRHPLLCGTKRAYLLDRGIIQEADLTLTDLQKAHQVALFNAMIELGEMEIPITDICL